VQAGHTQAGRQIKRIAAALCHGYPTLDDANGSFLSKQR
jgi:hypothetical protein